MELWNFPNVSRVNELCKALDHVGTIDLLINNQYVDEGGGGGGNFDSEDRHIMKQLLIEQLQEQLYTCSSSESLETVFLVVEELAREIRAEKERSANLARQNSQLKKQNSALTKQIQQQQQQQRKQQITQQQQQQQPQPAVRTPVKEDLARYQETTIVKIMEAKPQQHLSSPVEVAMMSSNNDAVNDEQQRQVNTFQEFVSSSSDEAVEFSSDQEEFISSGGKQQRSTTAKKDKKREINSPCHNKDKKRQVRFSSVVKELDGDLPQQQQQQEQEQRSKSPARRATTVAKIAAHEDCDESYECNSATHSPSPKPQAKKSVRFGGTKHRHIAATKASLRRHGSRDLIEEELEILDALSATLNNNSNKLYDNNYYYYYYYDDDDDDYNDPLYPLDTVHFNHDDLFFLADLNNNNNNNKPNIGRPAPTTQRRSRGNGSSSSGKRNNHHHHHNNNSICIDKTIIKQPQCAVR